MNAPAPSDPRMRQLIADSAAAFGLSSRVMPSGAGHDAQAMAQLGPMGMIFTARGESLASHRDGRGAPRARRDDREYCAYLREEQRSPRGCLARRMQPDFHHGLFIPSVGGISHSPKEFSHAADIVHGANVLLGAVVAADKGQ